MDINQSLQNLLNNTATKEDIALIKRLLASGEISIGGNVNQSVIIIGSGNTVELPPAALDRLNARPMLGNLDRDLTGEEITSGLRRLEKLLPNRAPVLIPQFKAAAARLRPTLKTEVKALSESARRERLEALASVNSICVEAVDVSFNSLALGESAPDYDARSPFRGLESFRPEDSEFFFGREALTQKLVGKIKAHSFLAVLGASGSGKSSLVMAGVIPALDLDYVIFRPGTNPLGGLESARGKSLIVVDQFEELFTLTRDESTREDFIARLLDESSRAKIILTLRSDFLGDVGAYRTLSAEIQNHLEITPPMDMDELRRAMEGQAGVVGLRFEADLSQQILDDVVGEPGAMPLLQHALWELWNRRHGRNLRASEYRAFGGVKQAITSTAEQVYADCSKPEQDALRDIFLRLTRLDDGDEGRDTRRRVPLDDLIPSGRDAASITLLLDKLANARLIVKSVNDDKTEVEVAHEALIRHWERLRIWLNEDRDALRLRESVSESAKEWEKSDRHESLLNSRWVKLDEALLLTQDSHYPLTEVEQAYLKGCVALRNRDQRERERRSRSMVFASIAAAVVFIALGSFGLVKSNEATSQAATAQAASTFALNNAATAQAASTLAFNNAETARTNADEAKRQSEIALARQLAAQAQSLNELGGSDQLIAALLAIQSIHMFPTDESAQVLQMNNVAPHIALLHHDDTIFSVAFSPDGKFVVTGGANNKVTVWEIENGKEVISLNFNTSVYSVVFSPDGEYVVTGGEDNKVTVWEIENGIEVVSMTHDDYVQDIAFSPDGKYIASGSRDETIRVWEVASGKEVVRMIHDRAVYSVEFSPDGKYLVTGGGDNTVRVWKVASGKEIIRMIHDRSVLSAAFSPDGKYVVSGSFDNSVRLWEVASGKEVARMIHDGPVFSVDFSPNGYYVISAGGVGDQTARVWEIANGKEIARMIHDSSVFSVDFSPDGKHIVSGGFDGNIQVGEVAYGKEVTRMTHDSDVLPVIFSPDGKYIASGSLDETIRVWEVASGKEIARMIHDGTVFSLAFSPDGKHIVSGSVDKTVRVWDIESVKEVARMIHDWAVLSVAFSPDGKYIISNSDDGIVKMWDVASGKAVIRMTLDSGVSLVAFSPDGKYIASGNVYDGTIQVWEVASGNEVTRMIHGDGVWSLAFSPDGKYILSGGGDHSARLWEVISGREIFRKSHDSNVRDVAFSLDGNYIATVSYKTIHMWEVTSGKEVTRVINSEIVNSIAFSPNGIYIVSGSNGGLVQVWLIDDCLRMPRNLTHEEWDQYIGDALPYQAVCPNLPIEP